MQRPSLGDVEVVASPINMSGLSKDVRLPTPEAGAHTDEVLRAAGYSEADIGAMRQKGVV
jgi:formyl-CoA transferase